MLKCAHCGGQWTYSETLKRSFRMKMVCPYCKKNNYISMKMRKKSMLFVLIAPIFSVIGSLINLPVLWIILTAVALLLAILSIIPFFMETSQEEEPLW